MRQKNDEEFIKALNNLAKGVMTEDDIKLINSRHVNENEIPKNAIHLFYENDDVDEYNEKKN